VFYRLPGSEEKWYELFKKDKENAGMHPSNSMMHSGPSVETSAFIRTQGVPHVRK
jgi:hypothetical protein